MRSINIYHQNSSGKKNNTAGRASLAAGLICMLMSFLAVNQAHAQAATRTSTVFVAGGANSPDVDSLWTMNAADYSIVKRLSPSLSGFTITGINGIATKPGTNTHYAIIKVQGGGNNRRLATINTQTGVCTLVGELGDNFSSLAFNANGTLYGVTGDGASVPSTLYRISLTDASKTPVRTLGNGDDGELIAFNPDDNMFYHWSGNGSPVFERFDTSGVGMVESITAPLVPFNEAHGAIYIGGGQFLVSDPALNLRVWTVSGTTATISSPVASAPYNSFRGFGRESRTSLIDPWGPTTICSGSGVTLEVTGGTGGYTWYKDGVAIPGETNATYTATSAGVYNSVYADINGIIDSPTTGITVTMLPDPGITFSANPQVCFGATNATISYSTSTTMPSSGTMTYNVPWGVTSLNFDLMGAGGGADTGMSPNPGMGGRVQGTLTVVPGDMLNVTVGGQGNMGALGGAPGGFNGGGASLGYGGSGGGATDIRLNGTSLSDRVAVAGGGAGSGGDGMFSVMGGFGGSTTGGNGEFNMELSQATGGTPTAGGAGALYTLGNGMDGAFGLGGASSAEGVSGGGGAGYYGGGGGAWSGGGGGSSYTSALLVSSVTHTAGVNAGNGSANISFDIPSGYTYSITWDAPSITAGFTNVAATAFPAGGAPIDVTVPATATPDTYTGTLYVSNGTCTISQPISVLVKPIPDVNPTADQAVCNGATTTDVLFTGSLSGTNFNWTNSLGTVGIPASGSGDITGFTAINGGTDTAIATITVTPELNGCFGTADEFDIIVKPTPSLSVANAGSVCDNTTFNYTATSATEGTTFAWERAALTGDIVAASNSGAASISETFDNTGTNVIPVNYSYTLTAAGCENVETMTVSVNPTPVLTGTMLPTVCSGSAFMYTQASSTSGVVFSWSRAAVTGISEAASSGTGNINETLTSTLSTTVSVTYIDTLDINGCKYTEPISVVVNPMPHLTSVLSDSVCNTSVFDYNSSVDVAGTNVTWTRFAVPGITTASGSGPDTINETHTNITDEPVTTTYVFTLDAAGCINTQNVTLMVNPTPQLNTTLTPAAICDSTFFSYTPGSNTSNATFAWTRPTVPNITNAAGSGTGSVNERLRNSASFPVPVTYVYTSIINGCTNAQNVVVNVNPTPRLSNPLPPAAICDSALFTFAPASATVGTSYAWTRPFVSGIPMLSASGTGNVSERLDNGTNDDRTVTYIYTLTANGCQHVQNVAVKVHPTPTLRNVTDSACSGVPFVFTPETYTIPVVTYSWMRLSNSSVSPSGTNGTNGINETLNNGTTSPVTVNYVYTVTVAGSSCSTVDTLEVLLRPSAAAPIIAVAPSNTLCGGVMYQNFGAQDPAASGTTYTWSATNAEVYATGAGNQYALVNFNVPSSTAVIKLTSTVGATGCIGVATYTVTVGAGAATAAPKVIYTKGKFICLQNNVKRFQWGYDDAATLDSIAAVGEINQSYFVANPDWNNRYYWVAVASADGSCVQKAYYNRPNDNTPRESYDMGADVATGISVFPNPTSDIVNVEITTEVPGAITVELVNALGQKISGSDAVNNKATFNVANLPGGFYMVDCYQEGHKVGSAKFVKN